MWKQPVVFREQHNGPSVLSRRLIESAAEAVLFVSVKNNEGGPYEKKKKKKPKAGRRRIPITREEGHVIRDQHHGQRQTAASDHSRDTAELFTVQ